MALEFLKFAAVILASAALVVACGALAEYLGRKDASPWD